MSRDREDLTSRLVSYKNSGTMPLGGGTTAAYGALLFLLLTSSLLPILYEYHMQHQREKKRRRSSSSIEESIISVANMTLQIRRQLLESATTDGEEEEGAGEQRKRRRTSRYNHGRAQQAIYEDYFAPIPVFNDKQFERMYRVTKSIVQQVFDTCARTDPFFTVVSDVTGRYNIGPMVKVLMSLKLLGYGCSASAFQDYFQMSITTARKSFLKLCRIVSQDEELRSVFARPMTRSDARRVSSIHEECHGIAGMIGSLDCMHVFWKNCPVAWQGSQQGKSKKPSIVLEAFADHNLWFWHHSFGWPGSLNDINIWDRSPLLKSFLDGSFASDVDFEFTVGGKVFQRLWLAVDGIYPELSRFVKTVEEPCNTKSVVYSKWQEATRKDIERAFGVLQRKFQVLVKKIELWYVSDISDVVNTAIILHNMMVGYRIDNDETECESFYAFSAAHDTEVVDDEEHREGNNNEQEQLDVNRRLAEMDLHRRLYDNVPNAERNDLTTQQRKVLDGLQFQYAQRRWECLYDRVEHHRLRNACMDALVE